MLFNSLQFFFFFPIVVFLYFWATARYQWVVLLIASCIFYAAFIPGYLLILFALIAVDYTAAIFIARSAGRKRKGYLWVSIISTCAILFLFKYFNFFSVNVNLLASTFHWNYSVPLLHLVLPIGLSFHTFQSLSYVIEVYRGKQRPEKHLGIYALYVLFFPQLVAGPIERPQNMLHQFHEVHRPNYPMVVLGLRQMLWGFFKKMVIADNLAPYVNSVYADAKGSAGNNVAIAVLFFAIQIYCDFSGYSDIAIGAARVMGFNLMTNFNFPYFSTSVSEFWTRWHISLSTWFRDYIYIPLGGSRISTGRWCFNILIVFLLSALWHGAGYTFIVWGLLHAAYLLVSYGVNRYWPSFSANARWDRLKNIVGGLVTFLLVSFAWIFFRATDMHNAITIISRVTVNPATFINDAVALSAKVHASFPARVPFIYVCLSLVLFIVAEVLLFRSPWPLPGYVSHKWHRWGLYYCVTACILLFGVYDITPDFIYFQF